MVGLTTDGLRAQADALGALHFEGVKAALLALLDASLDITPEHRAALEATSDKDQIRAVNAVHAGTMRAKGVSAVEREFNALKMRLAAVDHAPVLYTTRVLLSRSPSEMLATVDAYSNGAGAGAAAGASGPQ
jgi:hypothetical protein